MVKVALTDKSNTIFRIYIIWDKSTYYLVENLGSHCIELTASLNEYDELQIPFLLLDQISISQLYKGPYKVHSNLYLKIYEDSMSSVQDIYGPPEDNHTVLSAYKWSIVSHLFVFIILFVSGFIYKKFFYIKPNSQLTIDLMDPAEVQKISENVLKKPNNFKTVHLSESKIIKKVDQKFMNKDRANPPLNLEKPKSHKMVKNLKDSPKPFQGSKLGPKSAMGNLNEIDQIGGIGSSGLNSAKAGTGYGNGSGAFGHGNSGLGGGLGLGSGGGIKNGLPGKGLVSGLSGEGSQAMAASGYGDEDFSGGQIGRGGKSVGKKLGVSIVPRFDSADVEGGLAREQVEAVVRKNTGQLRFCYEKALQSQPELRGRLNSKWLIGPQGNVQSVKIIGSSIQSKDVEICVQNAIKGWKFPRPIGGVRVDVDYPFDFNRLSADFEEGEL